VHGCAWLRELGKRLSRIVCSQCGGRDWGVGHAHTCPGTLYFVLHEVLTFYVIKNVVVILCDKKCSDEPVPLLISYLYIYIYIYILLHGLMLIGGLIFGGANIRVCLYSEVYGILFWFTAYHLSVSGLCCIVSSNKDYIFYLPLGTKI
jgi:hypothetical protein